MAARAKVKYLITIGMYNTPTLLNMAEGVFMELLFDPKYTLIPTRLSGRAHINTAC